jgi:DNA invertase Pin-like site-specific DNA recombinase
VSTSTDPLRVLGYVRVSTGEQARSGLGLTAQERAIRDACRQRGWQLVEVLRDDGASGKDLNRPGIQEALRRIAAGDARGLVTAKLDRLSRSLVDAAHLLAWFDRANAALVAVDLGIDTSTTSGRLVASVMAAVAEWERSTISARTRDAAAVRRAAGGRMGRPSVRDTRPDIAARIAAGRAAGLTWQAIADQLNRDAVPTVRGGSEWRVSSVQSAAGYIRPPSAAVPATLPAISRRGRRR